MNTKTTQTMPFGLWSSPIGSSLVSQQLRLDDVQWSGDGKTIVWLEGRSGKGVLVSRSGSQGNRWLTDEQSVRGGVGYGGGGFHVRGDRVVFADRSGQLFARSLEHESPRPITPAYGSVASPTISPDGAWVLYVFSDNHTDLLGLVDTNGKQWPVRLVEGADFYMQPAWHPHGDRIAWIEWDHPNMPWDGTRLMMGRFAGEPTSVTDVVQVAGGEDQVVFQPVFSPDGRWLSYIAGDGEWERMLLLDLETGESRVLVEGDQLLLSNPGWVQGIRTYGWSHNSQRLYYLRNYAGYASLWVVDLSSGESRQLDIAPYTWASQLSVSPTADELLFLGSAPHIPERVVQWDEAAGLTTVAYTDSETIPPEFYPQPQALTWDAPDGMQVHGLYYPPANPNFTAAGLPPAIVYIHGGPTSQSTVRCSAERAYFTSRGYGWLEVNYRGSTGYGRTYQDALRQRWGLADVEDAIGGARALADRGLADASRLIISGGSAGGYTVLNALVRHPGVFKAGVCRYGVSNLFSLAMETHKFEARYNDQLIGPLPEAAGRYHEWSPIFHAENIRDALIVFQGDEDKVVPPNQSESIVEALKQRGVPHVYRLYPGEGHGFRKSESIADYLQQTEQFLQQHVLFAP